MAQTATQTEILAARAVGPKLVTGSTAPVGACSSKPASTCILIDGLWYDLTKWKHSHPGGPKLLEHMHGHDATDAFYSLHSDEAIARLKRFPTSSKLPASLEGKAPPPPTKVALAFRKFRQQLIDQGYYKRSVFWEAFYTLSIYFLGALGTWCAYNGHPVLAVLAVGFAMQQAGWIAHDFIHLRGGFAYWNAVAMQWVNGFSREWWSQKHNTHHVFTNYIGIDADIQNDPIFHLFFPDPKDDVFFRKMQHWYFVPVASLLYFSWRIQSIKQALHTMDPKEILFIVLNYTWMLVLGWQIAIPAIYLGGFLVSFIVTATHQSEEMIDPDSGVMVDAKTGESLPYSFCEGQFATTRDARTSDFFTEWLWGGMQYQLEHHLFPTMPKYRYREVAPLVKKFAEENGIEYRCDESQIQIFLRNYETLKFFAQRHPTGKSE